MLRTYGRHRTTKADDLNFCNSVQQWARLDPRGGRRRARALTRGTLPTPPEFPPNSNPQIEKGEEKVSKNQKNSEASGVGVGGGSASESLRKLSFK